MTRPGRADTPVLRYGYPDDATEHEPNASTLTACHIAGNRTEIYSQIVGVIGAPR